MNRPRAHQPSLLRRLGLPVLAPIALAGVLVAGVTTIGPTALAGGSAVSYVQRAASGTKSTQGTSTQVKVSSRGVAAGDALIVSVLLSSTSNQAGAVTVADAAGNTYAVDKDQTDGSAGDRALVLSAHGVTALAPGSVITVTYPSSSEFHGTVDEFAGVGAVDQSAGASATSAAYSSGPTGTAGGELVFGAVGDESGSNPPTVAGGWTGLPSLAIGHDYLGTGYQVAGGTSATFSGTVGGTWMAMAVSYTTTGVVTPPPTTPSPTTPPTSTSVSIVPTSTLSSSTSSTSSPTTSTSSTTPGGGSGGAGADVGPIGTSVSGTAASSGAITVGTGGVAAGDGIVISVLLSSTHSGTVAASDSAGNTYSVDKTQNDGSGGDLVVILSAHNVKALAPGTKITVTFPASSEHHVAAEEFSGLGALDKSASAFATSANFASGPAAAGAGEIVVGTVGAENGTATPTFGAGWHALQTLAVSSDYLGTAYQVAGSAGSFNATGSSGGTWMAVAVSYLASGGSGSSSSSSPTTTTSSPTTTTSTSTSSPTTTTSTTTTTTSSSPSTTTSSSPTTTTSSTTTTTTSSPTTSTSSTTSTTSSPSTTSTTSSPTASTSSTTSTSSPSTSSTTSSPSTTTSSSPAAHSFVAYGGYMDTHHSGTTNPKPMPWQGSANTIFSGQSDTSSGGWDGSAVRVDNTSGATESITLTVDIGSRHFALWGTVTVPAGYSLVATQQGNASFDGSDTNPAGCYGCNPTLCQTAVSSTIPVVHVNVDGILTDVPDVNQILNTKGADSAGCPYTGTRNDESQTWTRF